jgi:hypothetical protein
MTLPEIDDALAAWNARLSAAAQNLMDLQSDPTYEQLTGAGGLPKASLTGVTAGRVLPALGAMATAFQHFTLLNQTIDRAGVLRRNLPALFGADQKLREIEALLCSPSIHLPAVDVPLEQRTLLSGVQNVECISPNDLLAAMVKAFQAAKDAVVAVDTAWNSLIPALDRTKARIISLRARITGHAPEELDIAERALQDLRKQALADPLGVSAGLDAQIQPVLARVEATVEARERIQRNIVDGLAAAHAQFDALTQLHRDTMAACTIARIKVTNCGALPSPQPDEKLDSLRQWLARLKRKAAEGMLDPVAVGLRNWNLAAQECVSKEGAACAANRAPVDERNELRGRLDALKAKARTYGVAEDDTLVELSQQAEQLLFTRPTPLDQAAAAVASYEKTLNGAKIQNILGPGPLGPKPN